jgi:hypothetical protein
MASGYFWAAAGTMIGVLGGLIGTYASIVRASAAERPLVIKLSVLIWVLVLGFLALYLVLPNPYGQLLAGVYGIALFIVIRVASRRLEKYRRTIEA